MPSSADQSTGCLSSASTLARLHKFIRTVAFTAMCLVAAADVARAVAISAAFDSTQAGTNHMGLPAALPINPGAPDFGSLGLAAPGSGTNTVTVPFAYPANAPNAGNPVQMYGDAISSITNLGAGAFQVEVTVTNFAMNQGTPVPTDEYVYLNVWETFTGLGLPASVVWSTSGTISVSGFWSGGPASSGTIEPIAIVFDPSFSTWGPASPFFGSPWTGPGGGLLTGSQTVNPLVPYVAAGQLTVGMQSILKMQDLVGAGGNSMNLPTSLHLSVTMVPVEVPEPSSLVLAGMALAGCLAVWRRRAKLDRG